MSGVQKPAFDVFLALVKLAAYVGRPYIIVTQRKLLQRIRAVTGRAMCRRTLNYHLAALERLQVINRTQRHHRERGRPTKWRATLFTFAHVGLLWISAMRDAASIRLGRQRVQKPAHSWKPSLYRKRSPVGKPSTGEQRPGRSSAPKGRRNGPEKRAAR